MSGGTQKPSQADLLLEAGKAALGPVNVALPARVLSYDRATQTATIQVTVCYRVRDADGAESARCRPPVARVPVQWVGATWELSSGDTGLAVFCDRAIDVWKATGSATTEPPDPRRFDQSDAVFLPGVAAPADPLPSEATADGAVVLWDRGTSDIRLGSASASAAVVLETGLEGSFTDVLGALQTAATAAGLVGDAAQWSAFSASLVASLASWPSIAVAAKVKAE